MDAVTGFVTRNIRGPPLSDNRIHSMAKRLDCRLMPASVEWSSTKGNSKPTNPIQNTTIGPPTKNPKQVISLAQSIEFSPMHSQSGCDSSSRMAVIICNPKMVETFRSSYSCTHLTHRWWYSVAVADHSPPPDWISFRSKNAPPPSSNASLR